MDPNEKSEESEDEDDEKKDEKEKSEYEKSEKDGKKDDFVFNISRSVKYNTQFDGLSQIAREK